LPERATSRSTLLASRSEVDRCLSIDDVITVVEEVFRAHGQGLAEMPPKITLDLGRFGLEAWTNAMPAYVQPTAAAGIKWAGGYARNPATHGLPYVMATIILQDPATGYPIAVMEGGQITNLRTGAVVAVCIKHYARPQAHVMAIVGAGVQGRFALTATARVADLDEVRVTDIRQESADAFALEMSHSLKLTVKAVNTVEAAVRGADVVVTATPADAPLVSDEWLAAGTTAISMGSFQEFADDAVLTADKIVVDSWEQCAHRGELKRLVDTGKLSRDGIFAEVGETVAGVRPGRQSDNERIMVVPIGLGSHDIAVAHLAYERLKETKDAIRFDFLG
jgi:alanine dehydrogenase